MVFVTFDNFKDSRVNSPHPQGYQAGDSLVIKEYTGEDFCEVFLVF